MENEERAFHEATLTELTRASISRRQLLKATVAGLAVAAIPGAAAAQSSEPGLTFPFFPQITSGRYTTETVPTIATIAITAEALAVTVLTAAVNNASTLGLTGVVLDTVRAALVEEQDHYDLLASLGVTPVTTTFTVPDPKILTDYKTFFHTLEVAENLFIAAYMTATREFAELGQPTLAKIAYQIGGTEAEHRVLVRAALALGGDSSGDPPNNKGFETDLLLYVSDAATILKQLGFIGGSGASASYPGRAAAVAAAGPMATAVIQQKLNNANSTVTVTGPADLTGQRT